MSPHIEWHVGEDAAQETIAKTSPSRRSPLSRWLVISAIGLGVGLGLLYRSIPEPPANPISPTPAPAVVQAPLSPPPTPQTLAAAIERDALHLASRQVTEGITFNPALGRMPQDYADWYAALQNAYGRWGPPAYQTLYTVFETGTLPSGVVWVKLGQFRHGDFYRHTRFYRLENDHWTWTLPDWSFWSGPTAVVMTGDAGTIGPVAIAHPIGPVMITHPIEDAPVIGAVFDRFTRAYLNLCESLKCPPPIDRARLWTPGLTLTISIEPILMQPVVKERGGTLLIDLPSPRVVGYYEDANAVGDPFVAMAYATLIDPVVRLASGDYARWETDHGGELFLQAIAVWKRAQVREARQLSELFYSPPVSPPTVPQIIGWRPSVTLRKYYSDLLRDKFPVPLGSLWDWHEQGDRLVALQHIVVNEAEAVVAFIDERYDEEYVVRFLNVLGRAQTLDEAIETALPVSFEEFNQQWRQWIAGE